MSSNSRGGVLRKTLVPGAMIVLGVAFLVFVGWQAAALLNRLLESPIRIVTGFEGSPATKVTKISNTHWVINVEDPSWKRPHFFLFRVEGAAGRTVAFEFPNREGAEIDNDMKRAWSPLNPVYSYATSLDDLAAFSSVPMTSVAYHKAPNGSGLPNTSGQSWQFIENAGWQKLRESKWHLLIQGRWWQLIRGTEVLKEAYSFSQRFDKDAYVCMRYPYTPGYNQRYLDSLTNSPRGEAAGNPAVRVITVGTSEKGRPLQVVKIGEGGAVEEGRKPCVLVFAREYGDEQDSSWAAQGAIEFLISDAPEARQIRDKFTFLVIPVLDPDGAAIGVWEHIILSFLAWRKRTPESVAYSEFFKAWVDKGNPLQLVLNVHNLEGGEGRNLMIVVPATQHREYSLVFYNRFLRPLAEAERFRTGGPWNGSGYPLGNWLSDSFGTVHMSFEVNAREFERYLTIADLRQIGKLLVLASSRYLSSQEAESLLASVDAIRRDHAARWQKYRARLASLNPIEAEIECKFLADSDSPKWEALRARPPR